ncbi:malonate decarboxylase subunit beta [Caballeronia pedi]|uniref:Malonate decarboxylase subunit beta n=1 Tax=Caballeronia pedi TaxID=1777141 RepID=A0A157ZMH2_9BURK|nr:biotin-independent malonate decarboxylase subunit beta [Caballeronia pedi]SAK46708.1 malonate decarboxylase subunit beta [Caballeronia pedi]
MNIHDGMQPREMTPSQRSYQEASARERARGLCDAGSFTEWLDPRERLTSPHLAALDTPVAFDDGVVIGAGSLAGERVFVAAQEGRFMGGAVGEIHGAKLTGLLRRAVKERPAAVLLMLETGGVRLHEANAGLVAISEIQRAVFDARHAGVPVIVLIGGGNGCYGGMGIVARCCDAIVMSEAARLSVSGPEVIETARGVEEFDAKDRALVWRTMGGKHRYLLGEIDRYVDDDLGAFREAAATYLNRPVPLDLDAVLAEHARIEQRLARFGACEDALDIWTAMGIDNAARITALDTEAFLQAAACTREEHADDAL